MEAFKLFDRNAKGHLNLTDFKDAFRGLLNS
jgi:Ca2+-binding EF-hand superfamily protein